MNRHKSRARGHARSDTRTGARHVRLAEQIRKDLAVLIQRELNVTQAGIITLTEVMLSVDYAHAKVYFTVMGSTIDAATALLNEKAGWLHSLLFKRLHIHTVPTLRFVHDDQQERGLALMRLIEEVNRPVVGADATDTSRVLAAHDPDSAPARDPDIPIPDDQP